MGEKSARKNDSGERETDDADRSAEQTQEEKTTDDRSDALGAPTGSVRVDGRADRVRRATTWRTRDKRPGGSDHAADGYVEYERGPDRRALSERYGMDVRKAEGRKLQRLENEFGGERVRRWAEEGMTVETMGNPRDMQAFRKRQKERAEAVPTDIEQRNEASAQRNTARNRETGPAGEPGVPAMVRSVVSSPGKSLDEPVQRKMESKIGGEFGDVRIHTGPKAAAAADSINARAFTVENHVAFNRGEYRPNRSEGQRVLAHELTHVRQQTDGAVSLLPKADADHPGAGVTVGVSVHVQPKLEVSSPNDPAEQEAEEVAQNVMKMDAEETTTVETDSDTSFGTESADSEDTDRAKAGTDETGASPDASDADVDRAEAKVAAESVEMETSDTDADGGGSEGATEPTDDVQRVSDANSAGDHADSGPDSDGAAVTDETSKGTASLADGTVTEATTSDDAAGNDSSLAVGAPGDSPTEDGTISVGRRAFRTSDASVERRGSAIEALYDDGPLQAKLEVSSPDDPAEKEAERVAERVVRPGAFLGRIAENDEATRQSPESAATVGGGMSRSAAGRKMPENVSATVRSGVRGGGKPLPAETRAAFESKMGMDFSEVQVHTDSTANEAARSINAKAYTIGSNIAFAKGNYNPGSQAGRKLLAHELTHVAQQSGRSADRVHRQEFEPRVPIDDEDPGMVEDIAKTTVQNMVHDVIEDGAKQLAKKAGVSAGKASLVGAAVIATKKCAIAFAKRAAKEMRSARKRIYNWIEKQVEKSSAPEFVARARAAHKSQGKALAEVPNVLWEGLKGVFNTLVTDVLYGRLLGKLNDKITGKLKEVISNHAPNFASAAQSAIGAMPASLDEVTRRFASALQGAASTVTTKTAAMETGKSIAELRTAIINEAKGDVPITELGTTAVQLAGEFSQLAGTIHDPNQELATLRDRDVKSDEISKEKGSEIIRKLYEFDKKATKFANAWTAGSLPHEMVNALLEAGNRMSELYENYNWPLRDQISTLADILRNARHGPLFSYDVSEEDFKFYQ